MVRRNQVGQGDAAIGVVARIELSELADHSVLTTDALLQLISVTGETGKLGAAAALKRVAGDIGNNLLLHRREIPVHRDAPSTITP